MSFIHFGCWNNVVNKNACFNTTFNLLSEHVKNYKVDFLSISGDNFYPYKVKNTKFDDGKLVYKEDKKVSLINYKQLAFGFNRLKGLKKKVGDIKMILGNHDLQTQCKLLLSNEFNGTYDDDNLDDYNVTKEHGCNIIQWEIEASKVDINIDLFHVYRHKKHLVLMIDTSMYTLKNETDEYIECYNVFISKKKRASIQSTYTIEQLRELQNKKVLQQLSDEILVLIGHHPMITVKSKKNDAGEPEVQTSTDIPFFDTLLKSIATLKQNRTIYYLCADLHLYQRGVITVVVDGVTFTIHQIVVGTGGTELDNDYPRNIRGENFHMTYQSDPTLPEIELDYQVTDYKVECGFLIGDLHTNTPEFHFKGVELPKKTKKEKGGRRTKKSRLQCFNKNFT